MLFQPSPLTERDRAVVEEIEGFRRQLRFRLDEPHRWTGILRRHLQARAVQGSNSIEGYWVSNDDALAAVDEAEPLDADSRTWAEIIGYRNALTYVRQLADDPTARLDESLLRSLHFMMLSHDLSKSPGRYRAGPIYVRDDRTGETVYEAPDEGAVPALMAELVDSLTEGQGGEESVYVRAAMAHLNLVMVHPFRDGNGRMGRCLQTLVLARDHVLAPEFSSIEEFLGRNTPAYYAVLADTGRGRWAPALDTRTWIAFSLRAHHIQAQSVLRRLEEADRLGQSLVDLLDGAGLPPRTLSAAYDAAMGLRVRRPWYEGAAGVETATAARDMRALVAAGLLVARGATRGRHYVGAPSLRDLREQVRARRTPLVDPYADSGPWPWSDRLPTANKDRQ